MFLDKGNILSELNKFACLPGVMYVSLYSREGMGKTRLIQEFSSGKKVLYFKAAAVLYPENFILFRDTCARQLDAGFLTAKKFSELLRMLAKYAQSQPLAVILDDFQNLLSGNRRFPSLLASLKKRYEDSSHLLFVLCKLYSQYEKASSKEEHPLLLRPFSFFELRRLYPDMSMKEQLLLYSLTGGIPGYLKYFPSSCSVTDRIRDLFFTETGALYRLPPVFTREYYSSSAMIRTILLSIGSSRKKLQEVCDRTGLTPSAAGSLLTSLSLCGLTERRIPVTEDSGSRRTLYEISDPVFRFWYTFVYPYRSEIETGLGSEIFENQVVPALEDYQKIDFEKICREFLVLWDQAGQAPFPLSAPGMWWGQHPTKKRTEYVSIAAVHEDQILLGTCFWTDQWIDIDALYGLQKHGSLFPHSRKWYVLFAKSDFVSGFETISGNNVRVFSLEQMCRLADTYMGY